MTNLFPPKFVPPEPIFQQIWTPQIFFSEKCEIFELPTTLSKYPLYTHIHDFEQVGLDVIIVNSICIPFACTMLVCFMTFNNNNKYEVKKYVCTRTNKGLKSWSKHTSSKTNLHYSSPLLHLEHEHSGHETTHYTCHTEPCLLQLFLASYIYSKFL